MGSKFPDWVARLSLPVEILPPPELMAVGAERGRLCRYAIHLFAHGDRVGPR